MQKETIWNKNYILLLITNTFIFTSMHMLSSTIANFSMSLSGGETLAGVVAGVFSVSAILVRPICGNLMDYKKKKALYLFSLIVIFAAMIGYSISKNNAMVIAARLVHGFGWGFATTIGMTMAINTVPDSKIGEASSIYGLANVMAQALGPNIGALVSENYSYNVMFLCGAAVVGIAIICLLLVDDQPVPENAVKRALSMKSIVLPEAIIPAIVLFLNGAAYSAITTFIIRYGKSVGIATPSIFFTVYSCVLLVVRLTSGKVVDKKGPGYIIIPGGFFFCGSLLLLAGLKNQWMLYAAALFLGPGYSGCLSTLMALSMRRTTREQRGMVSSTINIGMDLGTGIGSTVAGMIAGAVGFSNLYLILCMPVILSVLLFIWDQKQYKKRKGVYKNSLSDEVLAAQGSSRGRR